MRVSIVALFLAAGLVAAPAPAQEGHPVKGSWLGTWEGNKLHGPDIVVVMNWDGKNITGMINPGTDDIPFKSATLNPDGWQIRIEADAKDKAGNPVNYVIEGKIEGLAFHNRSIIGTWRSQQGKGAFKISRQ
ncbi:MAG TPA: hypothetical protein VNI78_11580 [Vicinamibacterales bacterium]|nr:hypothetical protein [Vicinamibacterales bacterium]